MESSILSELTSGSFSPAPQDAIWKQVNIGLVRTNGDAIPSARAMFRAVSPCLDHWRRKGLLHLVVFMRKTSDVRLRLLLRSDWTDIQRALDRELRSLLAQGDIGEHYWSRYLPEQDRFGGAEAMTLAHAYFHLDSELWLHLDDLESQKRCRFSPDRLLPAVLHHLFLCCSDSEGGARITWSHLAHLIGNTVPVRVSVAAQPIVPSGRPVGRRNASR